jgi:hypothetical protein
VSVFATQMMDAFKPVLKQIDDMQRLLKKPDNPVGIVHHIVARDDIPPIAAYRMWNTDGQLVIYINRGVLDRPPKRPGQQLDGIFYGYKFSIPIVYEEC